MRTPGKSRDLKGKGASAPFLASSKGPSRQESPKKRPPSRKGPPPKVRLAFDEPLAADLRTRILLREQNLIVLDKPAGLAVHPGPATPESLEHYLPNLIPELGRSAGAALRPAHRLDRDTSGCLVLAWRKSALTRLTRLFAEGLVEKTYWALVQGAPPALAGEIDLPLAKRSTPSSGWRMVGDKNGLPARTLYRVLGQGGGLSLLECRPKTGRTHQIRVHCAALGCPVLGDPIYGKGNGGPHHLLAREIVIPASDGVETITAIAPLPPHMQAALERAGINVAAGS